LALWHMQMFGCIVVVATGLYKKTSVLT